MIWDIQISIVVYLLHLQILHWSIILTLSIESLIEN